MKKKTKKNPATEINELILFTENESTLHNQFTSIMKNLSRKHKKGIYDPVLAAKLWKYWIDNGVKEYNFEFGSGKRSLQQNIFTMTDRQKAAVLVEAQNRSTVMSGEYLKNPTRKKTMARKKKRSAKQLANDKRLGRMAKARAKAKRGGRSRVTKKVAKKKARKKKNPSYRKSKQATASRPKLVVFNIFKCYGKSVRFLGLTTSGKLHWTIRDAALMWKTQKKAASIARKVSTKRGMSQYHVGVTSNDISATQIAAQCKEGKA